MVNINNFELKVVAHYNGHSLKSNGNVDFSVKCDYSELVKYIQLVQALNNDVKISAKITDQKPFKLGTFRVKAINIDDDGEGNLKFNSQADFVEVDNLTKLVGTDLFVLRFSAEIEIEDGEEDEN